MRVSAPASRKFAFDDRIGLRDQSRGSWRHPVHIRRHRVVHRRVRCLPDRGERGAASQLRRQRAFSAHAARAEPGPSGAGQVPVVGNPGKAGRDPAGLDPEKCLGRTGRSDRGRDQMTWRRGGASHPRRLREAGDHALRWRFGVYRPRHVGRAKTSGRRVRVTAQDRGEARRDVPRRVGIITNSQSREQPRKVGHTDRQVSRRRRQHRQRLHRRLRGRRERFDVKMTVAGQKRR